MVQRFDGEVGVQFTIHIANQYEIPEIAELGKCAEENGFDQIWINDNLEYRNVFVAMSAVASATSTKVGTAILVPYYRNPVDVADTLGSISELMDGQEISLGIGRGSIPQAGRQVETPSPYEFIKETTQCIDALMNGETIRYGDYELLTSYFNLNPEAELQLKFDPQSPVQFYMGGHGPTGLRTAGKYMDGLVLGGYFIPLASAGELTKRVELAEKAATEADPEKQLTNVAEINVSIAENQEDARTFIRPYVSHLLMGLERLGFREEFDDIGIDIDNVDRVKEAFDQGATIQEVGEKYITDAMVDAIVVAGTPDQCRSRLEELIDVANDLGFDQIVMAKLGPDYEKAMDLLGQEVLPEITDR